MQTRDGTHDPCQKIPPYVRTALSSQRQIDFIIRWQLLVTRRQLLADSRCILLVVISCAGLLRLM